MRDGLIKAIWCVCRYVRVLGIGSIMRYYFGIAGKHPRVL